MDRRNDESRSRPWLAVLAAGCLILQAVTSGLALGACASPSSADEPSAVWHAFDPPGGAPDGSEGHRHRSAPDCCFFACHLLSSKIATSSAEIVLGPATTATVGLAGPQLSHRGAPGHERLPQNPRAPPLPA